MPVAVVVEAAGLLEHARKLDAARPHVLDVRLRGGVAILERPLLLRLAPEDLVVAVAVERRVDVDQVHAAVRQLAKLVETVAAVHDPRIHQRRRPAAVTDWRLGRLSLGASHPRCDSPASGRLPGRTFTRRAFACHGVSLRATLRKGKGPRHRARCLGLRWEHRSGRLGLVRPESGAREAPDHGCGAGSSLRRPSGMKWSSVSPTRAW